MASGTQLSEQTFIRELVLREVGDQNARVGNDLRENTVTGVA